jgi:hypothetical protein
MIRICALRVSRCPQVRVVVLGTWYPLLRLGAFSSSMTIRSARGSRVENDERRELPRGPHRGAPAAARSVTKLYRCMCAFAGTRSSNSKGYRCQVRLGSGKRGTFEFNYGDWKVAQYLQRADDHFDSSIRSLPLLHRKCTEPWEVSSTIGASFSLVLVRCRRRPITNYRKYSLVLLSLVHSTILFRRTPCACHQ